MTGASRAAHGRGNATASPSTLMMASTLRALMSGGGTPGEQSSCVLRDNQTQESRRAQVPLHPAGFNCERPDQRGGGFRSMSARNSCSQWLHSRAPKESPVPR